MYIFENGSGSADDPFLIQSLADLQGIDDVDGDGNSNFIGRWFRQTVDIDCSSGFTTINSFKECHYDGNGKKITNLSDYFINYVGYDTNDEKYVNSISDLTFEDCAKVIFYDVYYCEFSDVVVLRSGGFCTWLEDSKLTGCKAIDSEGWEAWDETYEYDQQYGGLVAGAYRTDFIDCEVENVTLVHSMGWVYIIGGFAGLANECSFLRCSVSGVSITFDIGDVVPDYDMLRYVGGFVGEALTCLIESVIVEDITIFYRFYTLWRVDNVGGVFGYIYDSDFSKIEAKSLSIQKINFLPGKRCFIGGFAGQIEESEGEDCLAYDVYVKGRWAGGFSTYAMNYGEKGKLTRCAVLKATIESDILDQNVSSVDRWRELAGMVCFSDYFAFEECYALGINIPAADYAAGFIIESYEGSFEKCIAHSNITLDGSYWKYGAGFAAYPMGSPFVKCGAEVNLDAGSSAASNTNLLGGFAGGGAIGDGNLSFEDCYALGVVSGPEGDSVPGGPIYGGFIGYFTVYDVPFTNCFAAVDVTKRGEPSGWPFYNSGGFIGMTDPYGSAAVTDCFYDSNVSGHNDTGKGEPLSTALMKNPSVLTGFDFDTVWKIGPWSISGPKSVTDSKGEYSMAMKDGAINVYLEYDPSGGYPFLQFETKKAVSKSGKTKCDFYVR